jgi:hypothetical protein
MHLNSLRAESPLFRIGRKAPDTAIPHSSQIRAVPPIRNRSNTNGAIYHV